MISRSLQNRRWVQSNKRRSLPDVFALYAGDFDSDGVVTVVDFNLYQSQSALLNVYVDGDANLDKNVTVFDFNLFQPNSSKIGITEIRY